MSLNEIYKGTGFVGAGFTFLDQAPELLQRKPVQVGFFRDFFNPKEVPLSSRIFQYKRKTSAGLQEPVGKTYSDLVGNMDKASAELENYNVGSFGLGWNVAPQDFQGKVSPVTGLPMTPEEIIADMQIQAQMAWDNMDERALVSLLTTDVAYDGGFSGNPSYNWYTEFEGTSRPSAISMNLAGSVDHIDLFQAQVDILQEDADKQGFASAFRPVVICGSTFYASRLKIEQQEGLARELHGPGPDLQSAERPFTSYGGMRHAYFDGHDGIRYIRVNQSIGGTKSVAASNAFLVPEGIQLFTKAYAPSQSMSAGNKPASKVYGWEQMSDRNGITRHEESNVLYVSSHPKLIRKLTV